MRQIVRQIRITLGLLIICSLGLLWSPKDTQAQLPVIDAAVLTESVFTNIQMVLSVAYQILEITPVEQLVITGNYASTLGTIFTMIDEAQGLAYDVGSLQLQVHALFDIDTAPDSSSALRDRLYEIRKVTYLSYSYAMRTQTLLRTTMSALDHLVRLVDTLGILLGNQQTSQTMLQMQGSIAQLLAQQQVQTAAYERAQSVGALEGPLTDQSLHHINHNLMLDHPR